MQQILASLINGEPDASVSPLDRGMQFGDGVFETIAVVDYLPLCMQNHLERLREGCSRLRIPVDTDLLQRELLSLSRLRQQAVIRLTVTRGPSVRGYSCPRQVDPTRILMLFQWPQWPVHYHLDGVKVRLCRLRYGRNPALSGIKHLNRLEQVMARQEWSDSAIAEGLVMDEGGLVIEGTMSNVFLRQGEVWLTPDLQHCGISGVIRNVILARQSSLGISVRVVDIPLSRLLDAEELFLCNSLIGIWSVRELEGRRFHDRRRSLSIAEGLRGQGYIAPLEVADVDSV